MTVGRKTISICIIKSLFVLTVIHMLHKNHIVSTWMIRFLISPKNAGVYLVSSHDDYVVMGCFFSCVGNKQYHMSGWFGSVCFLQVEFHPRLCQPELRSLCKESGVCFQAYSSLGKGELLTDPVVLEVAENCKRTPSQVCAPSLLKQTLILFLSMSIFNTLFFSPPLRLSGFTTLGGAAGYSSAAKILKPRQNTAERGGVWLQPEWHGY